MSLRKISLQRIFCHSLNRFLTKKKIDRIFYPWYIDDIINDRMCVFVNCIKTWSIRQFYMKSRSRDRKAAGLSSISCTCFAHGIQNRQNKVESL